MEHTRAALKRNRGLAIIILALSVAYAIEPGIGIMANVCRDLLGFFGGVR